MTDGRTNGRTEAIAISPTRALLKKRGDNKTSSNGANVGHHKATNSIQRMEVFN